MPTLTRYFIKTGLLHFIIALLMGFAVTLQPLIALPVSALRPVYLHLLMVGWLTQLIIGVAYWMFPKQSKENPRGSLHLGWGVYLMLNGGLLLRVLGEPLLTLKPEWNVGWTLAVSAVLQLLAGYGFIALIWQRVRER